MAFLRARAFIIGNLDRDRQFFSVFIERGAIPDVRDSGIRCLIGPDCVGHANVAMHQAEIGALAFVGAIGSVVRLFQDFRIDVLERNVVHGLVSGLVHDKGVGCVRHETAGKPDQQPVCRPRHLDRMVGAGSFDDIRLHAGDPMIENI